MKRFISVAIACAATLSVAHPASADTATAKQFLQLDESEDGKGLAELKIVALEEGIRAANAHLASTAGSTPLYCQPASLVLTGSQLADMVGRAVGQDKTLQNVPVPVVLLGVLQKTFPCAVATH